MIFLIQLCVAAVRASNHELYGSSFVDMSTLTCVHILKKFLLIITTNCNYFINARVWASKDDDLNIWSTTFKLCYELRCNPKNLQYLDSQSLRFTTSARSLIISR